MPMKGKLLLLLLIITSWSFRQSADTGKDKGSFSASIDGSTFAGDNKLLRGILINKEASMDGRSPARTVISTNFKGPVYTGKDGRPFTESVEFEIGYKDQKVGASSNYEIVLQYQSTSYYMLKDQSKLNITQINWDADKKHFWLSATFDCKMRSMAYPTDGKKDVNLKGTMTDIRITVPSWIAAKN